MPLENYLGVITLLDWTLILCEMFGLTFIILCNIMLNGIEMGCFLTNINLDLTTWNISCSAYDVNQLVQNESSTEKLINTWQAQILFSFKGTRRWSELECLSEPDIYVYNSFYIVTFYFSFVPIVEWRTKLLL